MASQGPESPDTCSTDGSGGDWVNPDNVKQSDNAYATVTAPRRNIVDTSLLISTHFDFIIPSGATIDGIQVEMERKYAGVGGSVSDNIMALTKDGVASIGTPTDPVGVWSTVEHYEPMGSPTDLWGETWTPAEINDENFGFIFSATISAGALASCIAYIDHIRITVYYTEAAVTYTAVIYSQQ